MPASPRHCQWRRCTRPTTHGSASRRSSRLSCLCRLAAWSLRAGCAIGPWRRARGITGHLDEYHPVFRDGWKGFRIERARCESRRHRLASRTVRLLARRRAAAGLCPARRGPDQEDPRPARPDRGRRQQGRFRHVAIYWKKGYKPEGFNSWAHSQLGRALVALYQGTGDQRVLDALVKVYADYPANMGPTHFNE